VTNGKDRRVSNCTAESRQQPALGGDEKGGDEHQHQDLEGDLALAGRPLEFFLAILR